MSQGLVFAQFGLLATLLYQVYLRWPHTRMDTFAAAMLAIAIALGLWTLWVNRPGNFRIVPEPKQGAVLIVVGPYQFVRHPMYTSLLCLAAGLAWMIEGWWAWVSWVSLWIVLIFKAQVEERYLLTLYPAYRPYCQTTKRFVPFLF